MRQWLWLLLAVVCVTGAALFVPGLNRKRTEYGLTRNPVLENVPPELALATTALGGFRGIIVDVLWIRSMKLQQDSKFFELVQIFDWIGKLQPRCVAVWVYSAWNMAYNISVELPTAPERWRWIQQGISRLRDNGIPYNQRAAELYRELGWIYSHKIGQTVDDFHWYYKIQLAKQIEDVVGRGPAVDLTPVLTAARTLDELKQRAGAEPLLAALREAGYKPLRKPIDVLVALEDPKSPCHGVLNAPQYSDAKDEVVRFLRRKALVEHLKLDPEQMKALSDEIGPMDWRLSDPHALYYASLALKYATTEDFSINYDRIKYEAVRRLYLRGNLFFDRGIGSDDAIYLTSSNWRFVDAANRVYGDIVAKRVERFGKAIAAAHRNFLEEAIVLLYTASQGKKSREYFRQLRKQYPDEMYRVPYEDFVSAAVLGNTANLGYDTAKAAVDGVLLEALRWLAAGDDERSQGLFDLATIMWKRYQRDMELAAKRVGLPPLKALRMQARDRALQVLPALLRDRLRERLGLEETPQEQPPAPGSNPPKAGAKR